MIFNRLPPSGGVYCYAMKALRRHFAPLSAQTVVATAPHPRKGEFAVRIREPFFHRVIGFT